MLVPGCSDFSPREQRFNLWGGFRASTALIKRRPVLDLGSFVPPGKELTHHLISVMTRKRVAVWQGRFFEKEAALEFWALLAEGDIPSDYWRTPWPAWEPGLEKVPGLDYSFASQTFLTASPGSNQTYTSDPTWANGNNTIEAIGGGSSGASTGSSSPGFNTGGGGAGYALINNFVFATPGTTTATYQVGAGAAVNSHTSGNGNGAQGGATWFNSATNPGLGSDNSKLGTSSGGLGGLHQTTSISAGTVAGASANGWGQAFHGGGAAGGCTLTGASGAGGAGGPNGFGGTAPDSTSTNGSSAGGAGDNGTGAGGASGGNGSTNNDWDASHGSGGGGGGNNGSVSSGTVTAGSGGLYGGSTGAAVNRASTSPTATAPAAAQGIIVLTWTVSVPGAPGRRIVYRRRRN